MKVADAGQAIVTPTTPAPGAGQTPYTPPTPGPGDITVGGSDGFTPDYGKAIQNDPGYAAAQSANQSDEANAAAQRRAAIRSQVIGYGGFAPGMTDTYGDVDQATLDAAKGNQYSTLAGLNRNYGQSVDQFRKALAARGALQSGDLNYGQDQLDTGYGQAQYDAGNAFGNQLTGDINGYTGVLSANNARLAGAIQGAAANAYADPANRPVAATPGTSAKRNAALSSQFGRDIYTDDAGNNYNLDGSAWSAPTPPANATGEYDPWEWSYASNPGHTF